jgi:uncharacterized protein YbbC (DUF1343 family)
MTPNFFQKIILVLSVAVFMQISACYGQNAVIPGAWRTENYFPFLRQHLSIGVVANASSTIGQNHLVDSLLSAGIKVKKIFAPEHGFRGEAEAGEFIQNKIDEKTGLPIISLYGVQKKPSSMQMSGLDVMVFDIQDVGVRFFTYISTLYYIMEACAEEAIPLLVLDRPNPNGDYIDGPMLDLSFRSFVGIVPIPIVYGMTIGELARMINEEGWLKNGMRCELTVIPLDGYTHATPVILDHNPSPNLPNIQSIRLYPSLCLFEATDISVGRGTDFPFQVIGFPDPKFGSFIFVPHSIPGKSLHPLHEGDTCYGIDLRWDTLHTRFTLKFVLDYYHLSNWGEKFFKNSKFFDKLAGTSLLRSQILDGLNEDQIRESWQPQLQEFMLKRKPYLLYP